MRVAGRCGGWGVLLLAAAAALVGRAAARGRGSALQKPVFAPSNSTVLVRSKPGSPQRGKEQRKTASTETEYYTKADTMKSAGQRRGQKDRVGGAEQKVRQAGSSEYPYRPKFPTNPRLGLCQIDDFNFNGSDRLGKGGFGQVFKATHVPTGSVVAIKLLPAASVKDKPERVANEETIQYALKGGYTGELLCTMTNEKHDVFFAIEYFAGGNLLRQLNTMFPLTRQLLVKYVAQIVLTLRQMHADCIVYRDLKAENIMIDEDDNIKLIDFGLAVRDCGNSLTNVAGTLEYMAPEVAARKRYGRSLQKRYGRASDYFSLAVLVHLLYTSKLPYRHDRDKKDEFTLMLASGKISIPPTGDGPVDELIGVLSERDSGRRWQMVHVDFERFKTLAFFRDFDWEYYQHSVQEYPRSP